MITFNSQIRAFESLKRAATETEAIALVREGRLPYEVVVPTGKITSAEGWAELLRQAPYGNLLRNLNTFTRHGVFAVDANVELAVQKLTNERAVGKSRVLPFQFFNAWKAYESSEGANHRLADALRQALELSFVNIPSFGNRKVCLAPDVSSSMSGPASDRGTMRFVDIAGIFAGALLKRCDDHVRVLPFRESVVSAVFSKRDDIMVTAARIVGLADGGTSLSAPIELLLREKSSVDVFVGITDNEEWAGRGFIDAWREYLAKVNPAARAFLVTIAPHRDAPAPQNELSVRFIYGWSDNVLKYITQALETGFGQVEEVERMVLEAPVVVAAAEPVEESPDSDEAEEA